MIVEHAMILAAGRGNRLRPRTDQVHKCFTPIGGTSIIERLMAQLAAQKIGCVTLVVGYLAGHIRAHFGSRYLGMEIRYRENPEYLTTNNIVSLQLAAPEMSDGMLLIEADLIVEDSVMSDMVNVPGENVMLLDRFDPSMNGTVATVSDDGSVTDMVLKKDQTAAMRMADYYKTVNMYRFSGAYARELAQRLDFYVAEHGVNDYYEALVAETVREGKHRFSALLTGERAWWEVDNEEDLERAIQMFGA